MRNTILARLQKKGYDRYHLIPAKCIKSLHYVYQMLTNQLHEVLFSDISCKMRHMLAVMLEIYVSFSYTFLTVQQSTFLQFLEYFR